MSEITTHTTVENYKGLLQQYCHTRHMGHPVYEVSQQGRPDDPSWIVTIKYGQSTYTTPEPIHGSKRLAEQTTANQVLEIIESRTSSLICGAFLGLSPRDLSRSNSRKTSRQ